MASTSLGNNDFSNSKSALDSIANTYDSAGSYQTTTSPVDGSSGFKLDVRSGWKDYVSPTSGSHLVYKQRVLYQVGVYNSLQKLITASASATQSTTISTAQSALDSVKDFVKEIEPMKKDVYDLTDNGDTVIKIVQIVFCVYYAIVLVCISAMIIGTVFFAFLKKDCCRIISHVGWIVLTIFMILGFLFSTLVFPVSVVFIEGCDLIKLDNLKSDRGIIPQDAWDQVSVCLAGNGDLYTYKGLDTKISFAADIMYAFDIVENLYNSGTDSLIYNETNLFIHNVFLSCNYF